MRTNYKTCTSCLQPTRDMSSCYCNFCGKGFSILNRPVNIYIVCLVLLCVAICVIISYSYFLDKLPMIGKSYHTDITDLSTNKVYESVDDIHYNYSDMYFYTKGTEVHLTNYKIEKVIGD